MNLQPLTLIRGEALKVLIGTPSGSVDACVTSPPYWRLRDYGHPEQLGLEIDVQSYVRNMVDVFEQVRRVLTDRGALWLNLGDSYAGGGFGPQGKTGQRHNRNAYPMPKHSPASVSGVKDKDLIGIPWRVALALQDAGWWLRAEVIWHKPNAMPESVKSRPTRAHEHIFLLTKSSEYYFNPEPLRERAVGRHTTSYQKERVYGDEARLHDHVGRGFPWELGEDGCRSGRSVWTVPVVPSDKRHPAPWPREIARRCILSSCPPGGVVLDPFCGGSGASAVVAIDNGRRFVGIDLREDFLDMTRDKVERTSPLLAMNVENNAI